jgi:hypothetical protein
MEIISRSEAIIRGLGQYFTGYPCRNGHTTYRYTQSGTCAGCIRSSNQPVEVLKVNRETKNRIAEMIQFRSRVFDLDMGYFRSILLATAQLTEPAVQIRDIHRGGTGKGLANGSSVHFFYAFVKDVEPLQELARQLFAKRCMTVDEVRADRARIYGRIQAEVDLIDDSNWPKGDPR